MALAEPRPGAGGLRFFASLCKALPGADGEGGGWRVVGGCLDVLRKETRMSFITPIPLRAAVLAAAGLLAGGAALLPSVAQAQVALSVQIGPPPPPRVEAVPPPVRGHVWAPGHYVWLHGQYVWRRGHWVAERPGYAYVAPAWVQQGPRWVYQDSRWERRPMASPPPPPFPPPPRAHPRPGRGWGDRDHDGAPNRFDRRPSDPYRR